MIRIYFGIAFYFTSLLAIIFTHPPFSTALAEWIVVTILTIVVLGKRARSSRYDQRITENHQEPPQ